MESLEGLKKFYQGKKVLITGHTGFKGSWLCAILHYFGAEVSGISLKPNTNPSLYEVGGIDDLVHSYICDIRDLNKMEKIFSEEKPEIVFHLAAQPIVLDSYTDPVYTYETNVMGTVNVLECIRKTPSVKSVVNITTDKVYQNNEWNWGYREIDRLNGYDPYSNSKSCSELVTDSYKKSFLEELGVIVSTARAGNVIGGGDFANFRIIPDCVRAMKEGKEIEVRNPNSTRPYQHVLEPLFAYLMVAKEQYLDKSKAGSYNIGPDETDCITTGDLATIFCEEWGEGAKWHAIDYNAPHEANFLKLDCSKLKSMFGWKPRWNVREAVGKTAEWSKAYFANENVLDTMLKQIKEYLKEEENNV